LLLLCPDVLDGLGSALKLARDGSVERLDAAAFRASELVGDGQTLEVDQRLADGLEAAFDGDGRGGERWRRLGLETGLGVAEQLTAILVVGDTVGAHQGDGLVAP